LEIRFGALVRRVEVVRGWRFNFQMAGGAGGGKRPGGDFGRCAREGRRFGGSVGFDPTSFKLARRRARSVKLRDSFRLGR